MVDIIAGRTLVVSNMLENFVLGLDMVEGVVVECAVLKRTVL